MSNVLIYTLVLCFLFLQIGISSFFSFAFLGTLILLILFFKTTYFKRTLFIRFLLTWLIFFFGYLYYTYLDVSSLELIVSFSSLSKIAMFLIASLILLVSMSRIRSSCSSYISNLVFSASLFLLLITNLLYWLSQINLIPFLAPDYFYTQNSSLLDNSTKITTIEDQIRFIGLPRNDLFYGEPSFLALIIFVCCSILLLHSDSLSENQFIIKYSRKSVIKLNLRIIILIASFVTLLSLNSLSGFIYLVILFYFSGVRFRITSINILPILLSLLFIASFLDIQFILNRLDFSNSLSFQQRFISFLDLPVVQLLTGDQSISNMTYDVGFHNGFATILLLSGFAAIPYLFSLYLNIFTVSPVKYHILSLFVLTAIIAQNGAIFSLYKLFIFIFFRLSLSTLPRCSQSTQMP